MSAKVQQQANGEVAQPTEGQASLLPHLESLDRMLKLPVVDATWQQTQNVYGRVKGRCDLGSLIPLLSKSLSLLFPLLVPRCQPKFQKMALVFQTHAVLLVTVIVYNQFI